MLMYSDTVWRDELWVKMWDMRVRGKLWRVIKRMYDICSSAVLLGVKSASFSVEQGETQGCRMFLLKEEEKANLGLI